MAKTSIDRLLEALALVDRMQETVIRHEQAIGQIVSDQRDILNRLEWLETQLSRREDDAKA